MRRFLILSIALGCCGLGTAAQGQVPSPAAPPVAVTAPLTGSARWESAIAAFEREDAGAPPPKGAILFIGSSSIAYWKSVAADFPDYRVINRGFGGSEISDSVAFADRIVIPYAPRMIVFYAGGNDINAHKSSATVAADFRAFSEKIHAKLPQTDIAYISIAPNPQRWSQVAEIKAANALIAQYCQENAHLKYIDVFSQMLGEDGQPKAGIYRDDRLHMNAEGYKIWVPIVRKFLPPPDRTSDSAPPSR